MRLARPAAVVLLGMVAFGPAARAADDGAVGEGFDFESWRRGGSGDRKLDRELIDRSREGFSDRAVQEAIRRGVGFLWSQRGADGSWPSRRAGQYPTGTTALAAYALLAAGESPREERMARTLDWLAKNPSEKTYSLGLRCNVWYLANRQTGNKYARPFKDDLVKLLKYTEDGAYSYDVSRTRGRWDNSNSQYGVLGTWAGAMGNQEIPRQYWQLVLQHWKGCQQSDGGWGYQNNHSTATMTAGGIATLFVCFDNLFAEEYLRCGVSGRGDERIRAGLKWMDEHFNAAVRGSQGGLLGHGDVYYFLYGVERVGLASGFKYFGTQDWYKLGAMKLLGLQGGGGSWRGKYDAIVSTAFALLFLVRGQHAVAFNKLEYEGFDWNNRPRDLAGLTRWMSGALERTLNWQIISMKAPVEEWHDAPILYISGARDPNLTDAHVAKLRDFAYQGGTILSVTECRGRGFMYGIRKVYKRMFPERTLKIVPPTHPVYRLHHPLYGRPTLYMIDNGVRPLVIHCDEDMPRAWQLQLRRTSPNEFRAAANVLMYVSDMLQLRPRGVSHWPPKPKRLPARSVKLARVRYGGDWNPEPLAYERFARLMAQQAQLAVEVVSPVEAAELGACDARVATMTGTRKFVLTSEQAAGLRDYVASGGLLVIDAAGGAKEFAESAELAIRGLWGRRALRRLADNAPIYNLPGHKISRAHYRRAARIGRGLKEEFNLRAVLLDGRIAVLFSREDLTGGLVGCEAYDCAGYSPQCAFELMRNAVLYAAATPKAPVAAAGD